MKNNEFKELVDRDLSGLEWDERRRRNVLRALEGEERPVRKISTTFLIAAVVLFFHAFCSMIFRRDRS